MTLNSLTSDYLSYVADRGQGARELTELAGKLLNLPATTYRNRCLTRPVFMDSAEVSRLGTDTERLHAALVSLPDRLFGGDVAAFGTAVGVMPAQARAVARTALAAPTAMSRADFYAGDDGFKVLEVNMGSTLGGLDNALLNEALLSHPAMAEFVGSRGLTYLDTFGVVADTLRAECGVRPGDSPFIVAADWPESFKSWGPQLRYSAGLLARYGLDVDACSLADLRLHDGRVWLNGRAVDVLYRVFLMEDLMSPESADLIDPVLAAAGRGEVKVFTPIDADVYGSKGALAMLSDEANRSLFSADELASLDLILPWTRMARSGPVTVPGGERRDLAEYAVAQQRELILKPVLMHGGLGVLPGWTASPQQWRERLADTMDGPFVLQRRVRPLSEPFPGDDGLQPWALSVSVFHGTGGFGGLWVRGTTELDGGVMNISRNAYATCCFHPRLDAGAGANGAAG
jgi:hypothetical protein